MNPICSTVIFVSDIAGDFEDLDLNRFDLEVSEPETIAGIIDGIRSTGHTCVHLEDPSQLHETFAANPNCVVLSVWSGANNRNRRGLVPSVCETYSVNYIGADPYAAIISSDKELSKSYCSEFGLKSPKGILIRHENQWDRVKFLEFPVVVKPLMEGGSIGITQDSKVTDSEGARRQISALFQYYKPPILCEEFAEGREVSFCIVGAKEITHIQAIEVLFEGEDGYFENNLFSMHDKRLADRKKKIKFENVTNEIPTELFKKIRSLYLSLGKIDYMRIDGKFGSEFSCIELSTDPAISPTSLFAHSYYSVGKNYRDMISDILSTRLSNDGGET